MKTKREHEKMKWMFEWKKLVLDANKQKLFLITNILRFLKWILNINHCRLSVAKLIITITHGGSNQFFVHLIHLLSVKAKLLISCPYLWHQRPSGGSWWRSRGLARQTAWYRVFSPYRWSMAAYPRWPSSFWRPQRVVVRHRVSWGF